MNEWMAEWLNGYQLKCVFYFLSLCYAALAVLFVGAGAIAIAVAIQFICSAIANKYSCLLWLPSWQFCYTNSFKPYRCYQLASFFFVLLVAIVVVNSFYFLVVAVVVVNAVIFSDECVCKPKKKKRLKSQSKKEGNIFWHFFDFFWFRWMR